MKIELYPLDKMVIDGSEILLGMEQAAVREILGEGKAVGSRHYYYQSELAIDYDSDGKVEFIEFLGGIDGSLKPMIYGVSAFDTPADELSELLERENNGMIDDSEGEYSRSYLDISVGLYRSTVPSDVHEMIEEMKRDGIPAENNEDIEADQRKAEHWETIGIGKAGYYRR